MTISRISGRMLQDNLVRDANLSIATDVVYVDITNGRLGIKNTSPTATLSVTGTAAVTGNITGGNLTTAGTANIATVEVTTLANIKSTTVSTSTTSGALKTAGGLGVAGNAYIGGNVVGGNLISAGTASVADVSISSITANSIVFANSSKVLSSTGNLTFDGANLVLTGKANIDNIQLDGTSITSNANLSIRSSANGNITLIPNGTGVVLVDTTTSIVPPVGNTAQRPASPTNGSLRYNSDTNVLEMFSGSSWGTVNMPPFSSITSQTLVGDNSTVTFTLDNSTTAAAIIVAIGGTVQTPGVAYTVSGNQITFTEAPLSVDEVLVRFISESTTVSAVTDVAGTTYFKSNAANLLGVVSSNTVFQITTSNVFNISGSHSIQLPIYTVVQANALSNKTAGQLIYVSNGDTGNPCLAVYDGSAWRRLAFGSAIS